MELFHQGQINVKYLQVYFLNCDFINQSLVTDCESELGLNSHFNKWNWILISNALKMLVYIESLLSQVAFQV